MIKMKSGKMHNLKFGDIILTELHFVDLNQSKKRPALVLFEEKSNIIVIGITSNTAMKGIPLLKKEGALVDSIIKTNYIFTIDKSEVIKKLFSISDKKKKIICKGLNQLIGC